MYSEEQVEEIALSYNLKGIDGLAILYIAECYNKKMLVGSYYLVILDSKTNEIVYNFRFTSNPKGFGIKNYWAKTFFTTLKNTSRQLSYFK